MLILILIVISFLYCSSSVSSSALHSPSDGAATALKLLKKDQNGKSESSSDGHNHLHRDHDNLKWTKASMLFIEKAYTAPDYSALLKNVNPVKYNTLKEPSSVKEEKCSSLYQEMVIATNSKSKIPVLPSSAYDLPAPYAAPNKARALVRITDLLTTFNESNRMLVLMGDSITRNSLESLECIVNIESGFDRATIIPPLLLAEKIAWGSNYYEIRFPHPLTGKEVTFKLLYIAVWEKFRVSEGALQWIASEVRRSVTSVYHQAQLQTLFVFNVGLHEKDETSYKKKLLHFFNSVNKNILSFGAHPALNKFIYRETSVQHFNFSYGNYNFHKMETWKKKNSAHKYRCVPSDATDRATRNWRHRAEEWALQQSEIAPTILPFREVSRHYFDMHMSMFEHLRQKLAQKNVIDCTHFDPAASVILYRILWYELLQH